MNKEEKEAFLALPVILLMATFFAWSGSQGGHRFYDLPIYALCVSLAMFIQWVAFIPSFMAKTEKYYDLTGSLTYLSVVLFALVTTPDLDLRSLTLATMILIWAIRLGSFLFRRIQQAGHDRRFNQLKTSLLRFLMAWTLQGLWVVVSVSAALAAITSERKVEWDSFALFGLMIWIAGFSIEVISDQQKAHFRQSAKNKDSFINSGLWSWSRHPNYFGEIVLWSGIAIIAFPVLSGWQLLTLSSPILIALLLIKISGIPMLEERSDQKWGHREDYQLYKKKTSLLILWPPTN